jgi:hypothetical protein
MAGGLGLMALLVTAVTGQEKPAHKYVGVSKCAKLCHKSKKQGNQLGLWKERKHSKAYETLLTDEAKAVGKKVGVDAPEKSDKCLKCHATGHGVPAEFLKSGFKIEDGVQCESCHGPGEDYMDKKIMKDRKKAESLGLVVGDEKTCLGCHNDTSPTWKADRYTTKDGKKVGFDYETMWPKVAHPRPKDD